MPTPSVALVAGSRADLDALERVGTALERLGVPHTVDLVPAHLDPARLTAWLEGSADGARVVVVAAGDPLHLPALVAAHVDLPVVALPLASRSVDGTAALAATAGAGAIPVLAVAPDAAFAAAHAAARIVALEDAGLAQRLADRRAEDATEASSHRVWEGDEDRAVGFGFRPR
ncbi:MAG: AIR carboxylase family protein [Actinomycetes bacterium]